MNQEIRMAVQERTLTRRADMATYIMLHVHLIFHEVTY